MTPLVSIIVCVYNEPELIVRALDSVPRRDDIEVVVVDDGSTDNTLEVVADYEAAHKEICIRIIHCDENRGLGHTKNVAYDNCRGEYISQLDSDDYLYTKEYESVMNQLDGTDIVCFDLVVNSGEVFRLNPQSQRGYCGGAARFIRREFLGDSRCPEIRAAEDWALNEELLQKPHTIKFSGTPAYHYNFPREGSLYDRLVKGQL